MRLGRCSRAFVKPRTAVANLMASARTLSASIRSSVIGHHLPSSGRPCPARKVPPGTRLLSHSGANAGQQPTPPIDKPRRLGAWRGFLLPPCAAAKRRPSLCAAGSRARRETSAGRTPGGVRECCGQDRRRFAVVPAPASAAWMRGAVFRAPRMGQGAQATRSERTRQRVRERRSPPQARATLLCKVSRDDTLGGLLFTLDVQSG